jgi:hypothetical protein
MKYLDVPQSGSVAGETHSRNRFGQYKRTRATPVNPNSARQGIARGRLADFSAAWRALTGAQQAAWDTYSAAHTRVDSLGQTIVLTGHQFYVSVNLALANAGEAQVSVPPTDVELGPPALTILDTGGGDFTITFDPSPVPAATNLIIEASKPRSAGRRYESDYRFIASIAAAAATPADIEAAYVAKFGVPTVGTKTFVRAYFITDTGFTSGYGYAVATHS